MNLHQIIFIHGLDFEQHVGNRANVLAFGDAAAEAEHEAVDVFWRELLALKKMALHEFHLQPRGDVNGVALQLGIAAFLPNLRERADVARRAFDAAVQRIKFLAIIAGCFSF